MVRAMSLAPTITRIQMQSTSAKHAEGQTHKATQSIEQKCLLRQLPSSRGEHHGGCPHLVQGVWGLGGITELRVFEFSSLGRQGLRSQVL